MANNEMRINDMPLNTTREKEAHTELLRRAKHVKLDENATEHLVVIAEDAAEVKAQTKDESKR